MIKKHGFKKENEPKERIIKFGIMCSGNNFMAWQENCLKEILSLKYVHLSLLIVEDKNQIISSEIRTKGQKKLSKNSLFEAYKTFILKPKAERSVNIDEIVTGIPVIKCKVIMNENSQYFNQEDIEGIKKFDLDFILYFGSSKIRGDILNAALYGVWSYHHGDPQKYREGPPCFWEIYEKNPVTGVVLHRLTDSLDMGIILKKGYFKTSRSYARNIDNVYLTTSIWPAQVIKDIRNGNDKYLSTQYSSTNATFYRDPTNTQMVYYFMIIFKNYLIYRLELLLTRDQWNIGFVYKPIQTFLEKNRDYNIDWLPQKKNELFIADPFAIKKENQIHVFCEIFDYKTHKGEIATFNFNGINSNVGIKELDLNLSCHLSYPYLFEYKDNIYLVPESSEIEQIILYRAVDFPEKWERISTILDNVKAVDSTIFQYQGLWWLFYSDLNFGRHNNLYIWYTSNPLGEWNPHDLNPVKIDVRSSRCAGTPFVHDGILYRPSQDCSEKYGGKISINKVKKLSPHQFEEEVTTIIEPCKIDIYSEGRHTISSVGDITVIDGHRLVFIGNIIFMRLLRLLMRPFQK